MEPDSYPLLQQTGNDFSVRLNMTNKVIVGLYEQQQ